MKLSKSLEVRILNKKSSCMVGFFDEKRKCGIVKYNILIK